VSQEIAKRASNAYAMSKMKAGQPDGESTAKDRLQSYLDQLAALLNTFSDARKEILLIGSEKVNELAIDLHFTATMAESKMRAVLKHESSPRHIDEITKDDQAIGEMAASLHGEIRREIGSDPTLKVE